MTEYERTRNEVIDEIIGHCQIVETQPGYVVNRITEDELRSLKTREEEE